MRRLLPVSLVVGLAALAACGTRHPIAAGDIGSSCVAGVEAPLRLSDFLTSGPGEQPKTPQWLQLDRREQLERGDVRAEAALSVQEVRLASPRLLSGPRNGPASLLLSERAAAEAADELSRGSKVILLTPPVTSFVRVAAAVRSDGSVTFLGECADMAFTTPFAQFTAARNRAGDSRPAAAQFLALASEPALATALRSFERPERPAPKKWADLPSETRFIDPDGKPAPPASVLAGMKPHWLHFQYPEAWKQFDGRIATYVPGVGWNPGVPFGLKTADPAVIGHVSLTAPLEIWLIPGRDSVDKKAARLGVFKAADLAGRDDVHFRSTVEATSMADLIARAKSGGAVFTLASK